MGYVIPTLNHDSQLLEIWLLNPPEFSSKDYQEIRMNVKLVNFIKQSRKPIERFFALHTGMLIMIG